MLFNSSIKKLRILAATPLLFASAFICADEITVIDLATPITHLLSGSNTVAEAGFQEIMANEAAGADNTAIALAGLATCAQKKGDTDSAVSLYRRASQLTPSTNALCGIYLAMAADTLHRSKKFLEAADTYLEAARLTPSIAETATYMAADSYERTDNIKKAEELYTSLLESKKSRAIAILRLGMLYERSKRYFDAEATYKLLSHSKKAPPAEIVSKVTAGLARVQIQNKRYSKVLKTLDNAPHDPSGELSFYKMLALSGLNKREEARDIAKSYIDTGSTNSPSGGIFLPEILFWDAVDKYLSGDYKLAREKFIFICESYESHRIAQWAMMLAGVASFKSCDYNRSVKDFAKFINKHQNSALIPQVKFYQAKALANLSRFEDAVLVLDDLIGRFHNNGFIIEATLLRGDCLFASCGAANNFRQAANSYALALAKANISSDMTVRASRGLARSLFEAGDSSTSKKVITQFSKTHPKEAEILHKEIFGNQTKSMRSE